ncbi:hypothetical protein LCGC14_2514900 [marine sediment metagenome]|uniref:Uncharacterized protein n=1 Tax=marine sediment metagenome TaxID=412755 RepID=A0A0F9AYK4_9ZZZZ
MNDETKIYGFFGLVFICSAFIFLNPINNEIITYMNDLTSVYFVLMVLSPLMALGYKKFSKDERFSDGGRTK